MPHLPAAELLISFRDGSEAVGRLYANVGGATEVAPARAAVEQLAGLVAAATGCAVVGYSITWKTHISDERAAPGPPAAGRAVFVFSTTEPDEYAVLSVPGVRDELVSGWEIDPTQEPIAELVEAIVDGIWVNQFGYDITALEVSFYEFKP